MGLALAGTVIIGALAACDILDADDVTARPLDDGGQAAESGSGRDGGEGGLADAQPETPESGVDLPDGGGAPLDARAGTSVWCNGRSDTDCVDFDGPISTGWVVSPGSAGSLVQVPNGGHNATGGLEAAIAARRVGPCDRLATLGGVGWRGRGVSLTVKRQTSGEYWYYPSYCTSSCAQDTTLLMTDTGEWMHFAFEVSSAGSQNVKTRLVGGPSHTWTAPAPTGKADIFVGIKTPSGGAACTWVVDNVWVSSPSKGI